MTRKDPKLQGILVAATTPFTADGSELDEATLRQQVDRLITAGVGGIVCCGTTGEFDKLSPAEYRRVIELYCEATAGRVPVVAGIGALSTQGAIELAQHAESVGADAIMLVPPFFDPLSFRALKVFLADVAAAINLRIVYYHTPGCTGLPLTSEQIAELGDIDGVDYLKDSSGDGANLAALLALKSDRIKAFNGADTLTFFGIASGAEASVWGGAGIAPELAVALWNALAVEKDIVRARELWKPMLQISEFLESVNYVAGVKGGMELVGQPVGPVRRPGLPLTEQERAAFRAVLQSAGAIPAN